MRLQDPKDHFLLMENTNQHQYERYIVHALEAHLRGSEWQKLVNAFVTTNCPRFRNFNKVYCAGDTSALSDVDIHMHLVHLEFITLLDTELSAVATRLGSTEERLLELLDAELLRDEETAHRLHDTLNMYRGFVHFSRMMEHRCNELYPTEVAETPSSGAAKGARICRVLWDLENVHVDHNLGGIATVMALQTFLRGLDLYGAGIDTRITAFFNPFNKSIPKKVIEELNKASVELVCASSKREDADRKLGMRINQEMQLLKPEISTFVLISSDQDFRQHIQLLTNAGYRTIVVHEARNENWRRMLEMHASMGVQWSTVCAVAHVTGDASATPATDIDGPIIAATAPSHTPQHAKQNHAAQSAAPSKATEDRSQSIASVKTETDSKEHHRDRTLEAAAVGWRVAVCQRWASAFGFLLVDVSHPAVDESFRVASVARLQDSDLHIAVRGGAARRGAGKVQATGSSATTEANHHAAVDSIVKVYVHHSVLTHKPVGQRMLRAGEYVLAQVVLDAKGPRAAAVKDVLIGDSSTAGSAEPSAQAILSMAVS
jgi:cold shock CspA family protein